MKSIIIITMLLFPGLFTEKSTISNMTYEAYLSGSEIMWKRAVQQAGRQYAAGQTNENLYALALSQFGLLSATMRSENERLFDAYADDTQDHLKQLIERGHRVGEAKALLASVYGFKIAYAPLKGMWLGPKNTALIEEALGLDPESPLVQKMYAQHQYFTPEMWGGDVNNALRAYERSIHLFERTGDVHNWMYLDNHAWLGMIYAENGNKINALDTWRKALEVEPDFRWIRDHLIPSVQ